MLQDYDSNNIAQKIIAVEEHREAMLTFSLLGGKLRQDGNQWVAMVGEMPENYVAGFGDTPNAAIYDFWKAMYTPLKK